MTGSKGLPDRGPLPEPSNPHDARQALKDAAFPAPDVQTIRMVSREFTSLCPRTGQPDFGTVAIEYTPDAYCVESKSLKYYLWSFRNEGEFCEGLAARIADDIVFAIQPTKVRVEITQNVRGGIAILAEAVRES